MERLTNGRRDNLDIATLIGWNACQNSARGRAVWNGRDSGARRGRGLPSGSGVLWFQLQSVTGSERRLPAAAAPLWGITNRFLNEENYRKTNNPALLFNRLFFDYTVFPDGQRRLFCHTWSREGNNLQKKQQNKVRTALLVEDFNALSGGSSSTETVFKKEKKGVCVSLNHVNATFLSLWSLNSSNRQVAFRGPETPLVFPASASY